MRGIAVRGIAAAAAAGWVRPARAADLPAATAAASHGDGRHGDLTNHPPSTASSPLSSAPVLHAPFDSNRSLAYIGVLTHKQRDLGAISIGDRTSVQALLLPQRYARASCCSTGPHPRRSLGAHKAPVRHRRKRRPRRPPRSSRVLRILIPGRPALQLGASRGPEVHLRMRCR